MGQDKIHSAIGTGDLAMLTKTRPKGPCACTRELFTDSDNFDVDYSENMGLTPQQKASMMGALILADYMFFEMDHGMCAVEGNKVKITLFMCYCCGAVVPAVVTLDQNQNGGGGGAPTAQEMTR